MLEVLIAYLDYGLRDFDQLSLDITGIILRSTVPLCKNATKLAEDLLDIVLARYLEQNSFAGKD